MDSDNENKNKGKENSNEAIKPVIGINAADTVDKYGRVIGEHLDAFEKLDPKHLQGRPNNALGKGGTKHGSAAEILHAKDKNIESILNEGNTKTMLSKSAIDPVTDLVTKDINTDKIIDNAQAKFCKTPEKTVEAFAKEKYNKNKTKIVPKDQLEEVHRIAKQKAKDKLAEAESYKQQGDMQKYAECISESKAHAHTAKHAKPATRKYDDAKAATANTGSRYNLTAKETISSAHEAGAKQMKAGAALAGGVSAAQNIIAVANGEKDLGEAIIDTAVDTAKGAVYSYGVTATSSIVSGGLQQVGNKIANEGAKGIIKSMSKGNAPALIVTTALEAGKSINKYLNGEIDGEELVIELGEKGTAIAVSTVTAALGADLGLLIGTTIGTITLPGIGTLVGSAIGSFVGGVIGGMVGYIASSQIYNAIVRSMSNYSRESEQYRKLAALYEQAYERMKQEREQFEYEMNKYHLEKREYLIACFSAMEEAVSDGDTENVNVQLGRVLNTFGQALRFNTAEEFDVFMADDSLSLKL